MIFSLARLFTLIYYFSLRTFGIKLRGLGIVQKLVTQDHILNFQGKKIYYSHKVRGSYDCLLIGRSNEPETHLFLKNIVQNHEAEYSFVDVGASIGEMIVGISIYSNVRSIYAFEPRIECINAISKTIELNHEKRIKVIAKAVGEKTGTVTFFSRTSGSGSGINKNEDDNSYGVTVLQTTLDEELPDKLVNPILLIDVEGHEPLVIKGGMRFIQRNQPLLIFEYNEISKKHFHISEIQSLLGSRYQVYRLRHDGNLDLDFEKSWNCVAVPRDTLFEEKTRDLIIHAPSRLVNK